MANGVFHTGLGVEINLNLPDLGHPGCLGLLEEITRPVDQRDRQLLECLENHHRGYCQAEAEDRSPWMTIRRRTGGGITTLVAAHLPVRHHPTAEEGDKHKAMKERIARAADRRGLRAQVEAPTGDGRVRTDVLVTGPAGRIGWEAQYSPITATTVRRRSQAAVERGITPMWVTNTRDAALIDRTFWARVDDLPWQAIASPRTMLIRGGTRHLERWKCMPSSDRICPKTGNPHGCGRLHVGWYLPDLCIPQRRPMAVDALVVASADGTYVPLSLPGRHDSRTTTRMWVPAEDRETWSTIVDDTTPEPGPEDNPDRKLTFTGEEIDRTCRYGEETTEFNDPRSRRDTTDATGLRTFDATPTSRFAIPRRHTGPFLTPAERTAAARLHRCPPDQIGPCAGCGTLIHRYGPRGAHACSACRLRAIRRPGAA